MPGRRIVVEFLGKDTSLSKTAKGADSGISKLSTTLGKLGLAFGTFEAAKGAISFLKESTAEARESQKVNAITANAIKSTGGAAKVTAGQVGDLATAISNKTGIDDEAVQSGANLLLTFKQIRNEAGKGNKIFDRTTKAAVDLSAAGFGSITSTSKQLGKALNDPIKGMSMLGRAGVTFTAGQEKQIKAMVKQGDLLGAQKLMLKEVESQVGGAAAASATAGEKLSTRWNNFKETIGTKMLPVIDKAETFLADKLIPALEGSGDALDEVRDAVAPVIGFFKSLGDSTDKSGGNLQKFRETVSAVWSSVQSIFRSGSDIVTQLWATFGDTITTFLRRSLGNIMTITRGAFTVIAGIFKTFSALLHGDWSGVWNGIKQTVSGVWAMIRGIVAQGWAVVRFLFSLGAIAIKGIFSGLWDGIKSLAAKGVGALVSAVKAVPGKIRALAGAFRSAGAHVLSSLLSGLKGGAGFVSEVAGKVWGAVKGMLNAAIRKINAALEFTIPIPAAPDIHVNPANIPQLYTGAIVKGSQRGTVVVAGDKGHDEAVIPLDGPYAPRGGRARGGDVYNFYISGAVDKNAAAREIRELLLRLKGLNGTDLGLA